MNLTNESYVIKTSGKSSSEYHYKDKGDWPKVSSRIYLKDRAGEEFANKMERHPRSMAYSYDRGKTVYSSELRGTVSRRTASRLGRLGL